MQDRSRPVASPQTGPHRDLERLVARHAQHAFRKPPAPYSRAAFAALERRLAGSAGLVLDAGCGTGAGTAALARRHPDCLVAGIDQSAHRLARAPRNLPDNIILLRADVVDLWGLLAAAGMRLEAHYLLYPNPWPKPAQVMRRWPGHPAFPALLALGGRLECRSNWRVYVEEFALAVRVLTGRRPVVEAFAPDDPLTPFERKYAASGHDLYRAVVEDASGAATPLRVVPTAP